MIARTHHNSMIAQNTHFAGTNIHIYKLDA